MKKRRMGKSGSKKTLGKVVVVQRTKKHAGKKEKRWELGQTFIKIYGSSESDVSPKSVPLARTVQPNLILIGRIVPPNSFPHYH